MATLNSLNKVITTTSQELTSTRNTDALLNNSRRNRNDINKLSSFINSVVIEGFKNLSSGENYPHDVIEKGISGNTVVTHLINCGNNSNAHEIYWLNNGVNSRPRTIKESFDYIISALESVNISNTFIQENERINDAFELINCNFNYIRKLSNEILGSSYESLLSCNDFNKTKTFTVSTHLYNVLKQLTVGIPDAIIEPYNQVEDTDYPTLNIPFERISGRIENLINLLDVNISEISNGQVLSWDDNLNLWVNKTLNVESGAENLSDLNDVNISSSEDGNILRLRNGMWESETFPEITVPNSLNDLSDVLSENTTEGNILVARSNVWTSEPAPTFNQSLNDLSDVNADSAEENQVLVSVGGTWVAQDLPTPSPTGAEYISELKDVDTTTHSPANGDLLVWSSTDVDNTAGDVGTWKPKSIGELGLPTGGSGINSNFQALLNGSFDMEITYSLGVNSLGLGGSSAMFMFMNTFGEEVNINRISLSIREMYSSASSFCLGIFNASQYASNEFTVISPDYVVNRLNTDSFNGDKGVGLLIESVNVALPDQYYVGLFLTGYEKGRSAPDEGFFITLSIGN